MTEKNRVDTASDECPMTAPETFHAETGVVLRRDLLKRAVQMAERACHDTNKKLRDAEYERDVLARQIGQKQSEIEFLKVERDDFITHMRGLHAAWDAR